MSKKLFDVCRILQWLIPAVVAFFGVLDRVFAWGIFSDVEEITLGFIGLLGVILQHESDTYFKDKDIVKKAHMTEEAKS